MRKDEPAASQGSGGKNPSGKTESSAQHEANGNWRRPVTNQDEQEKIINQGSGQALKGSDDRPSEGDKTQEKRLKPYKNMGDDSEEVKKETPTIE